MDSAVACGSIRTMPAPVAEWAEPANSYNMMVIELWYGERYTTV